MSPPPRGHGGSSHRGRGSRFNSSSRSRGQRRHENRGDDRKSSWREERGSRNHSYRSRSRSRSRRRSPQQDRRDRSHDRYRSDHHDRRGRRDRSASPRGRPSRPKARSNSPQSPPKPEESVRRRGPLPPQSDAFDTTVAASGDGPPPPPKQKPNFKNTGRLAAESNTVQVQGGEGVVLKYHEPPEARKPPAKEPWRMYVFKGEDLLEVVELGERSCWLVGREHAVVDFPVDHPSCSKQHAALQFRYVEKRNEFGDRIGKVKPYLLDLESSNGSSVNGDRIPAGRYVEVIDKDVLRFGLSTREYVLMLPN